MIDSEIEVAAVVTNPDRPAGRGMALKPSPVKEAAVAAGIEVFQPEKARDPAVAEWLSHKEPDVAIVVAYGKILPGSLLEIPRLGFVNVHFSLLPKYRGAAPVQRALIEGEAETGVSIMVLTEGMDEGPVLAMESIEVGPDDTAGQIGDSLADVGAKLLVHSLIAYGDGSMKPEPQDDSLATYAAKIAPEDARIDWTQSSTQIRNLIRGCNPIPGAWTLLEGRRLKIHAARPAPDVALDPGSVEAREKLFGGTGDVTLELLEVQLEGKKRMTGTDLARGLRLPAGSRFG